MALDSKEFGFVQAVRVSAQAKERFGRVARSTRTSKNKLCAYMVENPRFEEWVLAGRTGGPDLVGRQRMQWQIPQHLCDKLRRISADLEINVTQVLSYALEGVPDLRAAIFAGSTP